jgi:GNAT superfamily N-acetyltransferase
MDTIQTDVSDQALKAAIRGNLGNFFRRMGRSFPDTYFENGRFARWQLPVAHPWFNGVLSSRAPEESDAGFIEDCIQYFRARKVGRFTWWLEPHLNCPDWEPFLSRHGFGFSNDTPGMALDLQTLHDPAHGMDRLEIHEVTEEETLRTWSHVFTIGYGLPQEWEPAVHELGQGLGFDLSIRNFLGYWSGKPIATSTLFSGAGVAGIYNVATLPAARGKGIGAALTLQPLYIAREMGYHVAVLQSSEMGYNIYRKLGFRHLCQIEYFQLALP